MRAGELVALKWKDIDFEEHTISITKTYYNPTNNTLEYQLVPPKTRKSKRTIVVDEEVIAPLRSICWSNRKCRSTMVKLILTKDYFSQEGKTTRLSYFHQDSGKQNGVSAEAGRLKSRTYSPLAAPYANFIVSRSKGRLRRDYGSAWSL